MGVADHGALAWDDELDGTNQGSGEGDLLGHEAQGVPLDDLQGDHQVGLLHDVLLLLLGAFFVNHNVRKKKLEVSKFESVSGC